MEPPKPLDGPIYARGGSHVTPLLVPQPLGKTLKTPQTEHLIIPQPLLQKKSELFAHGEEFAIRSSTVLPRDAAPAHFWQGENNPFAEIKSNRLGHMHFCFWHLVLMLLLSGCSRDRLRAVPGTW